MPALGALFATRQMNKAPARYSDRWLRPLEGQSHRIETSDGASLLAIEAGSGPPVLLVHGLSASRNFWAPTVQSLLALGHRVIAIDQRGHGLSTVGTEGFTEEALADDLASVIIGLELTDTILVSHSFGGVAAQCLLVHRPELAARLSHVVYVASLSAAVPALRHAVRVDASRFVLPLLRRPNLARLATRSTFGSGATRAEIDFAISTGDANTEPMVEAATRFLATLDLTSRLSQSIRVPSTVVVGTTDRLTPLATNQVLADCVGASLVSFTGAGHQLPLERPLELAKLVHTIRAPTATVGR